MEIEKYNAAEKIRKEIGWCQQQMHFLSDADKYTSKFSIVIKRDGTEQSMHVDMDYDKRKEFFASLREDLRNRVASLEEEFAKI